MSHKEMQEAWFKSGLRATSVNYTVFRAAWHLAYAAGMERAAEICEERIWAIDNGGNKYRREATASHCAAAIRAEIKGK